MKCLEFEHELQKLIEERGSLTSPGLEEHALHCSRCRQLWEDQLFLDRAIPAWKAQKPQADFTESVLAGLAFQEDFSKDPKASKVEESSVSFEKETSKSGREDWKRSKVQPSRADHSSFRSSAPRRAVSSQMATVLLLGAVLCLFLFQTTSSPPGSSNLSETAIDVSKGEKGAVASSGNKDSMETEVVDSPSIEVAGLMKDTQSAYWGMAEGAAGLVNNTLLLARPIELSPALEPLSSPPVTGEQSSEQTPAWGHDWGRELKPIGQNVGDALDFLWNTVSVETTSQS